MPTVEKCFGGITQHDIFYWLSKAWRDKHDLMEECITPICINYRDSMDGKHFEATMTLVFDAIRYQLNKERAHAAADPPDAGVQQEARELRGGGWTAFCLLQFR
jgi:hypothetical protein